MSGNQSRNACNSSNRNNAFEHLIGAVVVFCLAFAFPARLVAANPGFDNRITTAGGHASFTVAAQGRLNRWMEQNPQRYRQRVTPLEWVEVLPNGFTRVVRRGRVVFLFGDKSYEAFENGYILFADSPPDEHRDVENLDQYPDMPRINLTAASDRSSSEVSNDKAQCHYAGVEQSGFDPTLPGAGVIRGQYGKTKAAYRSSVVACLNERGHHAR